MTGVLAATIPVSQAGGGFGFPILPAIIVLPVIAAVAVALVPSRMTGVARAVGIGGALATAGLALAMAVRFRTGTPGYQFVVSNSWIGALGISWKLGVDGISVFLVPVAALLFPVAMAGPRVTEDVKSYMVWMLVLDAASLGSFMALDLFVFFVFFELTLPPMYFLIGRWGGARRSYAALKFFLYTFALSALMLIALLVLVFVNARSTGHVTFDVIALTTNQHISHGLSLWLFLGFAAAFAVKIPIFPFHTWLPDAQEEASTGGSVILAGVMFILGTYGLVRFCIEMFPQASVDLAPLMLTLAVIGVIYGFLVAVVQTDLKRMIAYTLVADLGVIVVGLFGFTHQGLTGGVYQMVNHAISMGAMFLLIGYVIDRTGTRDLRFMGNLQTRAPILAAVTIVVTLSIVGVPGLNGFIGEFLMLLGTFTTHRWWAVAATVSVILSVLVFLWAYQQVFHGQPKAAPAVAGVSPGPGAMAAADPAAGTDLGWRDLAVVGPLVFLILLLGVYPRPFLERINPSSGRVIAHVSQVAHNPQPAVDAGTGGQP